MQIDLETTTGSEPITAAEVKAYLKIDFTDDDTLIGSLISQIRAMTEKATGLSLIARTITLWSDNEDLFSSWFALPYPKHLAVTSIHVNGTAIDVVKTGYSQFKVLVSYTPTESADNGVKIVYTADGVCPADLKLGMLRSIAETYEKRGNTFEGGLTKLADSHLTAIQLNKLY